MQIIKDNLEFRLGKKCFYAKNIYKVTSYYKNHATLIIILNFFKKYVETIDLFQIFETLFS